MRNQFVFATAVLLMGLASANAFAAQSIDGQQVSYIATGWVAEGLYVGTVVSNFSGGCGPRFRIEPNHPMLKDMEALLVSAFHTSSKVNLYVDGCIGSDTMNLKSVAITK